MSLQTSPSSVIFGAQEQWAPGIDCTNALANYASGTTPTSPTVVFTDTQGGTVVTLGSNPTVTGNVVTQEIAKSLVRAGHTYQLTLTFTPSGTTDILEAVLMVAVPGYS